MALVQPYLVYQTASLANMAEYLVIDGSTIIERFDARGADAAWQYLRTKYQDRNYELGIVVLNQ